MKEQKIRGKTICLPSVKARHNYQGIKREKTSTEIKMAFGLDMFHLDVSNKVILNVHTTYQMVSYVSRACRHFLGVLIGPSTFSYQSGNHSWLVLQPVQRLGYHNSQILNKKNTSDSSTKWSGQIKKICVVPVMPRKKIG